MDNRSRPSRVATFLAGWLLLGSSWAAAPCDCTPTAWKGNCTAALSIKDTKVKILTNSRQCTRVDWYVDDEQLSHMTILLDGAEIEDLSPHKPRKVAVQSCKICQDNRKLSGKHEEASDALVSDGSEMADASPFNGYWEGKDRNIFGFSHYNKLTLKVVNGLATGTLDCDGQLFNVSGTVSGTTATLSPSADDTFKNMPFRLIDPDTIEFSYGIFGSGTLKRVRK